MKTHTAITATGQFARVLLVAATLAIAEQALLLLMTRMGL